MSGPIDFDPNALTAKLAANGINMGGGQPPTPAPPPPQGIQGIPDFAAKLQGAGLVPPPMQPPQAPIGPPPPPPKAPATPAVRRDLRSVAKDEEETLRATSKLDADSKLAKLNAMPAAERERAMGAIPSLNVDLSGMQPPVAAGGAPGAPTGQPMQLTMPQGPTYVKAHYDRSRDPLRESTYRAMDDALQAQAGAAQSSARAQEVGAQALAEHYDNVAREEQDRAAIWQGQELQRQERVDQARQASNRASDEAAKLNVDPKRFMRNADTGTRLMIGIGAALSGGLGAMDGGGGRNQFMEFLDRTIDKDIRAQETDIDQKRFAANQADKNFQQLRQEIGDDRAADFAQRDQYYAYAESQVKAMLARTQSAEAKARGESVLADLQTKRVDIQARRDQASHVGAYTTGGASSSAKPQLLIKMPDGSTRLAPNEPAYNKATEKVGWVSNIQANINRALEIRKNASKVDLINPLSEASKELKSLQGETAQLVTVARGQGAMSKGDQAVADEAIGSMTGILDNNNDVLRATNQRWGQQLERDVSALGAEKVRTGYAYNAKGELVPTSEFIGESDKPTPQGMPKGARRRE